MSTKHFYHPKKYFTNAFFTEKLVFTKRFFFTINIFTNSVVTVVIVTIVTIVIVNVVTVAVVTEVLLTYFSRKNLTPWQPMRCSQGSALEFSRCFLLIYVAFNLNQNIKKTIHILNQELKKISTKFYIHFLISFLKL